MSRQARILVAELIGTMILIVGGPGGAVTVHVTLTDRSFEAQGPEEFGVDATLAQAQAWDQVGRTSITPLDCSRFRGDGPQPIVYRFHSSRDLFNRILLT